MFSFLLPSHIRSWPHPDNYISKLIYFLQFHCHPDSPGTITSHLDKSSLSSSLCLSGVMPQVTPLSSQQFKPSLSTMSQCTTNKIPTMVYETSNDVFPHPSTSNMPLSLWLKAHWCFWFLKHAESFPPFQRCICLFPLPGKYQPLTLPQAISLSLFRPQAFPLYRGLPQQKQGLCASYPWSLHPVSFSHSAYMLYSLVVSQGLAQYPVCNCIRKLHNWDSMWKRTEFKQAIPLEI